LLEFPVGRKEERGKRAKGKGPRGICKINSIARTARRWASGRRLEGGNNVKFCPLFAPFCLFLPLFSPLSSGHPTRNWLQAIRLVILAPSSQLVPSEAPLFRPGAPLGTIGRRLEWHWLVCVITFGPQLDGGSIDGPLTAFRRLLALFSSLLSALCFPLSAFCFVLAARLLCDVRLLGACRPS